LLEDRLPPGNMLSLGGDFLLTTALGVRASLEETSSPTIKTRSSPSAEPTAANLFSSPTPQKSPEIVASEPRASTGSTPSISLFFASNLLNSDTTLVNAFASLEFAPETAKATTTSTIGTASGGSAGITGELPSDGTVKGASSSAEITQMGSPFLVGTNPTAGDTSDGGGQVVARLTTTTTTPNGYASNISQLGGPVEQGRPSLGILLSNGNMDVRTPYLTGQRFGLTAQQLSALQNLQGSVNGLRVNVNTIFGTPSSMINTGGFLTNTSNLNPRDVVLQFIYANKEALGLNDQDVQEIVTTDMYTETVGKSISHVYLQQQQDGIPVFHGVANGSVMPDGRLIILGNHLVSDLAGSINITTPVLNQAQAIWFAAQNIGLDVTQPLGLVDNTGGPTQAQTYVSDELSSDPIPVSLMYLPIQQGDTRLVWHTVLNSPAAAGEWFEINVDAQTGHVWNRFNYAQNDSYRVLKYTLESPIDGSFSTIFNPGDPLANGFPNLPTVTWHNTDGDPEPETFTTTGNNVLAQEDRDGDDGALTIGRRPSGGASNDYRLDFDPTREPYEPPIVPPPPAPSIPAYTNNMLVAVIQAYYSANIFHDTMYRHGFTEAAGNFQIFNFGRGGRGNDPVFVDVQDDHDNGTVDNAFFTTPPDGIPGTATMFVFDFTSPNRDSAMNADVLMHELGHGWSTRQVGGPSNVTGLGGIQSGGAGEGWSDYAALWFTTKASDNAGDSRASGRYVLGQPDSGLGVRRLRYDTTQGTFGKPNTYDNPLTYNDIDPTAVDVVFPFNPPIDPRQAPADEIHNVGEIWCSTLWDLNWRLIKKYGFSTDIFTGNGGNNIALKIINEGLKLTPINPTFLNARDAILAADIALYGGANQLQIWQAFAGRAMGQFSNDGADHNSTAVREDYTVPPIPPFPGGGGGGGNYPGNGGNDNKYEPNDFSNQAYNLGSRSGTKLFPGLKIKGSIPQDRDWFRFKTDNSGSTTVQIDMASGAGDIDLIVYRKTSNGTLNEIGRSTNRQNAGSESVTFNSTAGVQYYFQVIGFNGGKGNYGIAISAP
jgi:extracellular elastinolytic metalloproteinase